LYKCSPYVHSSPETFRQIEQKLFYVCTVVPHRTSSLAAHKLQRFFKRVSCI